MINRKPQLQKPPRRQKFHFSSRKQMKHINLPFPSIKTAKNVDGSMKNDIPSMKTAQNVDGRMKYHSHPQKGVVLRREPQDERFRVAA